MVDIHTQHDASGYRTYIHYGRRGHVIDGNFAGDSTDIKTHQAANPYLYGT